ncbi:hypothetical protein ILYODFUR_007273 [Ilyodon furcidens]|uniref:Uncharacterized protein n=1 Tax=Ilyodon furcidens TaxID=33524 RepID=A0ABV0TH07_9TELE
MSCQPGLHCFFLDVLSHLNDHRLTVHQSHGIKFRLSGHQRGLEHMDRRSSIEKALSEEVYCCAGAGGV